MGDEFAVAVIDLRRNRLFGADQSLGGLAPTRMRHFRVNIGPEAIFVAGDLFPEADGARVGEGGSGQST